MANTPAVPPLTQLPAFAGWTDSPYPLSEIAPFSRNDQYTFIRKLEALVDFINKTVATLDANEQKLVMAWVEQAENLISEFNAITEQMVDPEGTVVQGVLTAALALLDESSVVATIVDTAVTDAAAAAALLYATQTDLENIGDAVVAIDADVTNLGNLTAETFAAKDVANRKTYTRYWDRSKIAFIGDSTTVGNQDGTGINVSGLINGALPDCQVLNVGRSGWASGELAMLWGAPVSLAAFNLPATTAQTAVTPRVTVGNFRSSPTEIFPVWTGELRLPDGTVIPAILRHTIHAAAASPGAWLIERVSAGTGVVAVPDGSKFVCTEFDTWKDSTLVINIGRNNNVAYPELASNDVAAIIAAHAAPPAAIIVLPINFKSSENVESTGYGPIKRANDFIKRAHVDAFVDHLTFAALNGIEIAGGTPTDADMKAAMYGVLPPYLMQDDTHPNQHGYRAFAQAVLTELRKRGVYGRVNSVSGVPASYNSPLIWRASDLDGPEFSKVTGWTDKNQGLTLTSSSTPPIISYDNDGQKYVRFNSDTLDTRMNILAYNLPEPFLVVAKIKLRELGRINPIIWADTSGQYLSFTAANVLSLSGNTGGAAIGLNQIVYVHALFDGAASFMKYDGISTQAVNKGAGGLNNSLRIGHGNIGGNQWSKLDLYELAIFPGRFTSESAYQMVSLMRDKRI